MSSATNGTGGAAIAHIVNFTGGPWEHQTKIVSPLFGDKVATTAMPRTVLSNQTQKSINEMFYNGTGYYIDDEVEPEFGFLGLNDLQTLFLACFATLIPLVISLMVAFGIRILWARYKRQLESPKYDGILERCATNDSISQPLHSHLLNSDKKCETHLSINTEEVDVCDGISQIRTNNHSNTNGSIITMTLKNNHLIVETEERNDIEEDSRETTMKYSPGARDGVFVVEVQQGVRRSPGHADTAAISDQCALVHNPPERFNEEGSEITSPLIQPNIAQQICTGLTQSDQSLTQEGHPSYCYTNQQCYDTGTHGYPIYAGYIMQSDTPSRHPLAAFKEAAALAERNKPKITAAVYKTNRSETIALDDDNGLDGGVIPQVNITLTTPSDVRS